MLTNRTGLVLTCFITSVVLAGCGSPAVSPQGTRQEATPPNAASLALTVPPTTVSAPLPTSAPIATAVPIRVITTSTSLPTTTALPTAAQTTTVAPPLSATLLPILSESNTRLTIPLPDGVMLLDFTVSPDNQYVVYVVGPGHYENATIYSVPSVGGIPVQLGTLDWQERSETYYSTPYNQYVITPDNGAVIFQDADVLYRVPITGGALQQLGTTLGAGGQAGPSTSERLPSLANRVPDFRLYPACTCIIYRTKGALSVLKLDGTPSMQLTNTPGGESYIYGYMVSPDGRWLLYDVRKYDPWDEPKTPSWGGGLIKIVAVYSVMLSGGAPNVLATAPTDDGAVDTYAINQEQTELMYTTYDTDGEGSPQGYRNWHVPLAGGTPTNS